MNKINQISALDRTANDAAGDPLLRNSPAHNPLLRNQLLLNLIPGVGPRIRRNLLDHFANEEEVLNASAEALKLVAGVGSKLAGSIVRARDTIDVDETISVCEENQISIIAESDPAYPKLLKEIHDPPGILFVRGKLLAQDGLSVAIVGTRHATQYGESQTDRLTSGLARAGLTINSGMARGVDGVAHRAALKAGGRTIAVLGSGLLNIYPAEHKSLADEIAANGAVISEYPPHRSPRADSFPARNRIVTGMSLGVVVVEASLRSGALISARHAMEQNREVFAVPGRVDNRVSKGCHQLLRDGAKLVESVEDVLEEFGPLGGELRIDEETVVRHPGELQLNEQELAVLNAIETEPTLIEKVASVSNLPIHRVLSTISVLEMRHLIKRLSGTTIVRK